MSKEKLYEVTLEETTYYTYAVMATDTEIAADLANDHHTGSGNDAVMLLKAEEGKPTVTRTISKLETSTDKEEVIAHHVVYPR